MGPSLTRFSLGVGLADWIRARAGRSLEGGALRPTYLGRAASAAFGAVAARGVARPVELPRGLRVIGIGSAVLGGAGKTPLAAAIARELARAGARVALVGHAYRASPGAAREVRPWDKPEIVGDDALCAARILEGSGVSVVVAKSRAGALAHARSIGAEVAVVDGLLQASPVRVADAVLVLDAGAPWGSRRCPPLGDLRAPEAALRAASDVAALVVDGAAAAPPSHADALPEDIVPLTSSIEGATDPSGRRFDLASLRSLRVGLLLGIARPERVLCALTRRGIEPSVVVALADHASFAGVRGGDLGGASVDAWLTTSRCATKLPAELGGVPVLAIDHRIDALPLCAVLLSRGASAGGAVSDASAGGAVSDASAGGAVSGAAKDASAGARNESALC